MTEHYLEKIVCEMVRNENNIIIKNDIMWYETLHKGQKICRAGNNRNLESCDEVTDQE